MNGCVYYHAKVSVSDLDLNNHVNNAQVCPRSKLYEETIFCALGHPAHIKRRKKDNGNTGHRL